MVDALGTAAFEHDIPAGIEGIDVGAGADPFQQAQRLAADAWGARRSWFLINGASQGNHAACLALRHSGRSVVVQRNVHSSSDRRAHPRRARAGVRRARDRLRARGRALPDAGRRSPRRSTAPRTRSRALTVSPTYFGAVRRRRRAGRGRATTRGVPLIVDEAWGAHLRFSPSCPRARWSAAPTSSLSSIHKIVGSLTQSAILHLGQGELDRRGRRRPLRHADRVDQPERAAHRIAGRGAPLGRGPRRRAAGRDALGARDGARAQIREIPGLDVLDERLVGRPGVARLGSAAARGRRPRHGQHRHPDRRARCASSTTSTSSWCPRTWSSRVFGIGEDAAPSAERLLAALRQAVEALGRPRRSTEAPVRAAAALGTRSRCRPREAFLGPQEVVPFDEAEGGSPPSRWPPTRPGSPTCFPASA